MMNDGNHGEGALGAGASRGLHDDELEQRDSHAGPVRNHGQHISKKVSSSSVGGAGSETATAAGGEAGAASGSSSAAGGSGSTNGSGHKAAGQASKNIAAPPVKAACTFCRSRKSKCNGDKPCKTCVARGRPEECIYTVSRRGGKPKKRPPELNQVQSHLQSLLGMTNLPHTVRVPGAVPQLQPFQQDTPMAMINALQQQNHAVLSGYGIPQQGTGNQGPSPALNALDSAGGEAAGLLPQQGQMGGVPGPSGSSMDYDRLNNAAATAAAGFINAQQQAGHLQSPLTSGMSQTPNTFGAVPTPSPAATTPGTAHQQGQLGDPSTRRALLIDYYRYLYRFIPVLLPPEHLEGLVHSFNQGSPFLLALQCILPLLRDEEQPPGPLHGLGGSGLNFGSDEKRKQVRDITSLYQRQASDAIENALEKADEMESPAAILEVIQALCVLIIYEYGSGRALKARLKADQALGLAMSKGLHRLSAQNFASNPAQSSFSLDTSASSGGTFSNFSSEQVYEMCKRTWWVAWSLLMWASYNTGRIPTIRADDPRVTSELPLCKDEQAWASNVLSLQALLLVQDRVLALAQSSDAEKEQAASWSAQPASQGRLAELGQSFGLGAVAITQQGVDQKPTSFSAFPTSSPREQVMASMNSIDQSLQQQISIIESRSSPRWQSRPGQQSLDSIEDDMIAYLHLSTSIQLYTAWLTLHLSSAFQGASLFERKLCFLNSVGDKNNQQVCQVPMPDSFSDVFNVDQSANSLPARSENDWLDDILQTFDGSIPDARVSDWTYEGQQGASAVAAPASSAGAVTRGPFDPRYSLDRCVYASKRLLELSRGDALKVNPFPACSHVLIAFTLLMQALSLSDKLEEGDDNEDGLPDFSRELLHSAQGSAALQGEIQTVPGPESRQERLAQLHEIWEKVKEARDTLAELSKYWDMVIPMADEVNLCLTTSQLLFDQQQ